MDQVSTDAFTSTVKAELFRQLGLDASQWQDLGGFESFVFANQAAHRVLRLTHTSHRSFADIESELEFLAYLKSQGGNVCVAVPFTISAGLSSAIQIDDFICCLFEMAQGKVIQASDWCDDLFRNWGRSIGLFHRLASSYRPDRPKRFDWRSDTNLAFRDRIPAEEESILVLGDRYYQKLHDLDQSQGHYGLIHSDAHAGNFFLHCGELTFFDFDDCCYQWYAFDVATILFSAVLQPWMENSQAARQEQAELFLPAFLQGYESQFPISDFMIEHFELFLKLRELSLYAVIHSQLDVSNLTQDYPRRFMDGRHQRLVNDLPYLNIETLL